MCEPAPRAVSFDLSAFRLNSPLGKRILAAAREGDYAHPGEEEAIVLTLGPFARKAGRRWLDAGCGRGGTAAFVAAKGWAEVTAFDIDAESIREARTRHPDVVFYETGVERAHDVIRGTFDLVYLFNAFYAFPDPDAALRSLRALAAPGAKLVLFDYVDRGGFAETPFRRAAEAAHWKPVVDETFAERLRAAEWTLEKVENLDADYERWYAWLVARFDERRARLLEIAPPEAIDHARAVYQSLLDAIRAGHVGGGIFVAGTAESR